MDSTQDGEPQAGSERLEGLWRAYAARVQAYACRHVDPPTAQEVVAETFLVAWRRIDVVPTDAMPWLLVVARNHISNLRRETNRRRNVELELAKLERVASSNESAEMTALERADVLLALALLTPSEREAVLLVSWDGLSTTDAARVAGCSPTALKVRLHRARKHLAEQCVTGGRTESASSDTWSESRREVLA